MKMREFTVGKMNKLPAGVALPMVLLCILAAVVNLSHSECEKRTQFAQTTDSFTVVFSACNPFDVILQAWLEPRGNVQNNHTHIWVHFTPKNLTSGSHFYRIGYLYSCLDPNFFDCQRDGTQYSCSELFCQRDGIQLHLRVADFNLKASTLQPVVGDNITLYCSSGLSKAIDVIVNFTFQTRNKTELITEQFVCNGSDYHLGNKWLIHRNGTAPYDCILEIIGVDESDSGMYQCIGDLRSSALGESENVPSNTVNISVITYEDALFPGLVTIVTPVNVFTNTKIISISIGATLILILIALSVIGWRIGKKYYNNEQDQPYVPIGGEGEAGDGAGGAGDSAGRPGAGAGDGAGGLGAGETGDGAGGAGDGAGDGAGGLGAGGFGAGAGDIGAGGPGAGAGDGAGGPGAGAGDGAGGAGAGAGAGETGDGAGQVENSGSSVILRSGNSSTSSKLTSTASQHQEEEDPFLMEGGYSKVCITPSEQGEPASGGTKLRTHPIQISISRSPEDLAKDLSPNIHEQVVFVSEKTQSPGGTPKDYEGPEDKNLTCPKCRRVYKIGQIQFYRKHWERCQGGL